MNDARLISINTAIRSVLKRRGVMDDATSANLARALDKALQRGAQANERTISAALRATKVRSYARYRVRESDLAREIADELDRAFPRRTLTELIKDFRTFCIRQLSADMDRDDEAPARSHLQTYLQGVTRTFREVPTGRGRTDILLGGDEGEIIEVKLWKGETYFEDGLLELGEYLRTEGQREGWYVVFDYTGAYLHAPREDLTIREHGLTIHVIWVEMPVVKSSGVGREKRRREAS